MGTTNRLVVPVGSSTWMVRFCAPPNWPGAISIRELKVGPSFWTSNAIGNQLPCGTTPSYPTNISRRTAAFASPAHKRRLQTVVSHPHRRRLCHLPSTGAALRDHWRSRRPRGPEPSLGAYLGTAPRTMQFGARRLRRFIVRRLEDQGTTQQPAP